MLDLVGHCKIALWAGPQQRGDAGVWAEEGGIAQAVFEVPALPDFSSTRFPDLQGLEQAKRLALVGSRMDNLLGAIHAQGPLCAASLRYWRQPGAVPEGRIRTFFLLRAWGRERQEAVDRLAGAQRAFLAAFPNEYTLKSYRAGTDPAVDRHVLQVAAPASLVEIMKMERVVPAWHDPGLCGFSSYYDPGQFSAAPNDMLAFCRSLVARADDGDAMVDITLVPTGSLTAIEQGEIQAWRQRCEKWGSDQRIQRGGGLFSEQQTIVIEKDPHADELGDNCGSVLERYGRDQKVFLYAVRLFGWGTSNLSDVAANLAATAFEAGASHWLQFVDAGGEGAVAFSKAVNAARYQYVTPGVYNRRIWDSSDAPETLRRLHRLANLDELRGVFRLPVPSRDGCPGIPLDSGFDSVAPTPTVASVDLGVYFRDQRPSLESADIPLRDLAKSALVVGMPGSGKTTLCFSMLTQLWSRHQIPFMVIEPAKTEYRSLLALREMAQDMLVFSIGNEHVSPFRFNPLAIPEGVSLSEHVSAVCTCFGGAFSLWDPLPMIVEEGVREAYFERGWSEYAVAGDDPTLGFPTLEDVYRHALICAERMSYRGETAGNIRGALQSRFGALLRGPKGRCLNCQQALPLDLLMTRPIVLELDALNADEKALMMMFMLTAVREYCKTTRRSGAPLSHVLLVEEAHNVIGRASVDAGESSVANPRAIAVGFFVNMLAEMRALGEGLVIADQLPTAVAPAAIKNTNVKIMHRLASQDDREELGRAMLLDNRQLDQVAMLPPGVSLVHKEGWPQSRLVSEHNFKEQSGLEEPQPDAILRKEMAEAIAHLSLEGHFRPFKACGAHCRRCAPRIREASERLSERVLRDVEDRSAAEAADDLPMVARDLFLEGFDAMPPLDDKDTKESRALQWFCAGIHLDERVLRRLGGGLPG